MYTFVKTKLKKCPNVQGWYLRVDSDNPQLIEELRGYVTRKALLEYNRDPHIPRGIEKGDCHPIYNPVNYGITWMNTIEKYRNVYPCFLINHAGGWMPMDKSIVVLRKIKSEIFEFPADEIDNEEWITISRFPQAKHYYLRSNKNRMFQKYNSLSLARQEALRFATKKHIIIKDANQNELPPEL